MNYYRKLYEETAYLLMLQTEMREYPFSTVVSRFIGESGYDSQDRAVEAIAVILALERVGEPMPADIIDGLDKSISEFDAAAFPENERLDIEAHLKTARSVIEWYRDTPGKIKRIS